MNVFFTFLFVLMFPGLNNLVHGFDNVILQVLLNNGNDMDCDGNDCCDEYEWDFISHQIYTMSGNQRQLRGNNSWDGGDIITDSVSMDNEDESQRQLANYPAYCAYRCAGYAPTRCLALNCKGYRRQHHRVMMESIRELFWSTNCENQKSEVNNLLNNICNNNQVSHNCKSYLMQPRTMTCYSNVDC